MILIENLMPEISWDLTAATPTTSEVLAVKQDPEPAPEADGRFATLTDDEIDNLAAKRTEKTTDRQTAWSLKIFKGKIPS